MENARKIVLFRSCFKGLENVYGTHCPQTGRSFQVKEPVSDRVIQDHLAGRHFYGVYLLVGDRTGAVVVDFDSQDRLIPMEFVSLAAHYEISAHIERSKSKGYHVWIFFEEGGVLALKARSVAKHILSEMETEETEVFPKQSHLGNGVSFGNFINAPLFGALVPEGKTVFIDPATFAPYCDQWAFLESVKRHRESDLDRIIDLNDIPLITESLIPQPLPPAPEISSGSPEISELPPFGLLPCARKMFDQGVSKYQRVSCFRLAVHLKRLGLPLDVTVSALKAWAKKNVPDNGRGVISEQEIIDQASYAFERNYKGLGCESEAVRPYCHPGCPVLRNRSRT